MSRHKSQKIQELHILHNVAEMQDPNLKNKLADFLKNKKPLTLELGCGKGEYTLALAKNHPQENFIGVDIQGERLWHGAKTAIEQKLNNVFFLRLPIENLTQFLSPASVGNIWLTFPDPQPRKGDIKKRLTSPRFLAIYKKILTSEGLINLKTDDKNLFTYSADSIKDFGGKIWQKKMIDYPSEIDPLLQIDTFYERLHKKNQKNIYYLQANLL